MYYPDRYSRERLISDLYYEDILYLYGSHFAYRITIPNMSGEQPPPATIDRAPIKSIDQARKRA